MVNGVKASPISLLISNKHFMRLIYPLYPMTILHLITTTTLKYVVVFSYRFVLIHENVNELIYFVYILTF